MKDKIQISRLMEKIKDEYIENIILEEDIEMFPSNERIKELAFKKLREQPNKPIETVKGFKMKTTIKIIAVVAMVCLVTVTAFAAANGGLDYFKSIFGSSAENIQDNITNPMVSEKSGDYRMTVESLLSDGYKTNIIVSLENTKGNAVNANALEADEKASLFNVHIEENDIDKLADMMSVSYTEMPEFSTASKVFYNIEVTSFKRLKNEQLIKMNIALNDNLAPIIIDLEVANAMMYKEISLPTADFEEENLIPEKVQISPMGVLLIGIEKEQKGGLSAPYTQLVFKNGIVEELFTASSFSIDDDDDHVTMGGGGMVLVDEGQIAPLVTGTMGQRNQENQIVMTGQFSRIINMEDIKAIRIEGKEYPVN